MSQFRVAVTHDLGELDATLDADVGLSVLEQAGGVTYEVIPTASGPIEPGVLADFDGLLLLKPRVTAETLEGADRLAHIARWGVGLDNVDVDACTQAGVLVTTAPDGVRRPVATAALTLLLALSHNLLPKHRLLRSGRWDRTAHLGTGLTNRVMGLIGVGNIGRDLVGLIQPLGMRVLAHDPYASTDEPGVEFVGLDQLLAESDFVCICCPLTPETHHLIGKPELAAMKSTACLINPARGPIVDQGALVEALRVGEIRAAGLDVFEQEPLPSDDPILELDNVIVAPHSLAWTDETMGRLGASACGALVDFANGRRPAHVFNPAVLDHPRLRERFGAGGIQPAREAT